MGGTSTPETNRSLHPKRSFARVSLSTSSLPYCVDNSAKFSPASSADVNSLDHMCRASLLLLLSKSHEMATGFTPNYVHSLRITFSICFLTACTLSKSRIYMDLASCTYHARTPVAEAHIPVLHTRTSIKQHGTP